MRRFLIHLLIGFLSIYLAYLLIPNVIIQGDFKEVIKITVIAGLVLGLINYFLKPIINIIALPIRLLTFGLFGLIINMIIVWIIDILFPQLIILGIVPLFLTSLLVWVLNSILLKIKK